MPPDATVSEAGTILIVDDDADIREAFCSVLEDSGYPAVAAANGKVALELLATGVLPGVILLDMMMPVMNGIEFLAALRADHRFDAIPVAVFSASNEPRTHSGAQAVVRKPIQLSHLLATIERLLRTPVANASAATVARREGEATPSSSR